MYFPSFLDKLKNKEIDFIFQQVYKKVLKFLNFLVYRKNPEKMLPKQICKYRFNFFID